MLRDDGPMPKRRIDPRVEIGAIRLAVADLDRTLAFYADMLGFDVTHRIGHSTALLSAGSSHPHILVTANADARPSAAYQFAIRYPDRDALAEAYRWMSQSGVAFERAVDEGIRETLGLRDPDGNHIELYYDRAREKWPLAPDGTPLITSQPLDLEGLRRHAEKRVTSQSQRAPSTSAAPPLTELTRTRLSEVRMRLLNLHKVLLDDAKSAYEMDRGRVGSSASLLQLVISDPWFAWLHPLSELVVRIDETLQPDAPATESDGTLLLEQVERLLSPAEAAEDFAQRYYEALQRQPAVIVAHAEVRRILKQAK
jgi:catechol 2,3-dioxygenase